MRYKDKDKDMSDIQFLIRYRTKEIMKFIIAVLIIILVFQTVSYNSKNGWTKTPVGTVDVKVIR